MSLQALLATTGTTLPGLKVRSKSTRGGMGRYCRSTAKSPELATLFKKMEPTAAAVSLGASSALATSALAEEGRVQPIDVSQTHVFNAVEWLAKQDKLLAVLPAEYAIHDVVHFYKDNGYIDQDLALMAIMTSSLHALLITSGSARDEFARLVVSSQSMRGYDVPSSPRHTPGALSNSNPYICGSHGGFTKKGEPCMGLGHPSLGGRCKYHAVGTFKLDGQTYPLTDSRVSYGDASIPRRDLNRIFASAEGPKSRVTFETPADAPGCPIKVPVGTPVPSRRAASGRGGVSASRTMPAPTMASNIKNWINGLTGYSTTDPATSDALGGGNNHHAVVDDIEPSDSVSQIGGFVPSPSMHAAGAETVSDEANLESEFIGRLVVIQSGKYQSMQGTVIAVSKSGATCKVDLPGTGTTGWLKCENMNLVDEDRGASVVSMLSGNSHVSVGRAASQISAASQSTGFAVNDPVVVTKGKYQGSTGTIERMTDHRVYLNIGGHTTGGLTYDSIAYGTADDVASVTGGSRAASSASHGLSDGGLPDGRVSGAGGYSPGLSVGQTAKVVSGVWQGETGQIFKVTAQRVFLTINGSKTGGIKHDAVEVIGAGLPMDDAFDANMSAVSGASQHFPDHMSAVSGASQHFPDHVSAVGGDGFSVDMQVYVTSGSYSGAMGTIVKINPKTVVLEINGSRTGNLRKDILRPVSPVDYSGQAPAAHMMPPSPHMASASSHVSAASSAVSVSSSGRTATNVSAGGGFDASAIPNQGDQVVIVSGKYKDQSGVVASVGNATVKVTLDEMFGGAITGNLKFAAVQRC